MAKAKEIQTPTILEGELGNLLAEYRDMAGYSISQMADALCLSEQILIDLENENFENLAQPPYIRGYLRNYAKAADKEADELIKRYETLRGADPTELEYHFKKSNVVQTNQKKSLSPIIIQVFFLALLLGIIAGIAMIPSINQWIKSTWNSFSNQTSQPSIDSTDNPLLTGTMPVPMPVPTPLPIPENDPVEQVTKKADNKESSPSASASAPSSSSQQLQTNTESKVPLDTTPTNLNKAQISTQTKNLNSNDTTQDLVEENTTTIPNTNTDTINLKLTFNEDVWMRIKDSNNKTVFEGLSTAGNSKILDLKKPLTFRVGNAPALSMVVDGKSMDISSYIKGSVANFTLE